MIQPFESIANQAVSKKGFFQGKSSAVTGETPLVHEKFKIPLGMVHVVCRSELLDSSPWQNAFRHQCCDYRYYEVVEQTLRGKFEYRYLILEDTFGKIRAIQPIFLTHQDLPAGLQGPLKAIISFFRKFSPNFLVLKMLMVGCSAGEGHLASDNNENHAWIANALHEALVKIARHFKSSIIVLKDFPSFYRSSLAAFSNNGYIRVPSMPAAKIDLNYLNFEDFMQRALSRSMRKNLRRKFRNSAKYPLLQMEVVNNITPYVDEIYPLYQQVLARSKLRFEELTKDFFCKVGQRMPDRTRFFVWRQSGKAVAFVFCMVHKQSLYDNYIGLDYSVALEMHLYFTTWRDVFEWAIQNHFKTYYTAPLNYDPKLHLRLELAPLDLYAHHVSSFLNPIFRQAVRFLQPVRHDPLISRFCNAHEL